MKIATLMTGLLTMFCSVAWSQDDNRLIQLSGIVRNELNEPQQFVHIVILNKHRGTISDQDGLFSFVVEPLDTILFSAVGLKKHILTVPRDPQKDFYHVEVSMKTDTIRIGEVRILPWKTYEEFRDAFLSLRLPDNDLQRAYRNLATIQEQINTSGSPDPDLNFKYLMDEYYDQLYSKGQAPYVSVFDPLRWKRFIEYLQEGKFRNERRSSGDAPAP